MREHIIFFLLLSVLVLLTGLATPSATGRVFAQSQDDDELGNTDQYNSSSHADPIAGNDIGILDDSANGNEDSILIFNVLANDRKALFGYEKTITVESVSEPSFGTTTVNSDNTITYLPTSSRYSSGTVLTDSFQYSAMVHDDIDGSDSTHSYKATVRVQITQVNDRPFASDSQHTVLMNGHLQSYLQASDSDGDKLVFAIVSPARFGQVELDAESGGFQYEPYYNYAGLDSFTYIVSDGIAASQAAEVKISVVGSLNEIDQVESGDQYNGYVPGYDEGEYSNGDNYDGDNTDQSNQTESYDNASSSTTYKPVAIAGEEINAFSGEQVMLNGQESYDPNGGTLTYSWSQVDGPDVVLSSSTMSTPTFIAPNVESNTTNITFSLIVSNGEATSDPSYVSIIVSTIPSVNIDILPGIYPNEINTNQEKETVPVAALGSDTLVASAYLPDSFRFGPNSTILTSYETKDVNGDGIDDIVSYFKIGDLGLDTSYTEACLTGQINVNSKVVSFNACDSVRITNHNKG
jgi:hypothetical protein